MSVEYTIHGSYKIVNYASSSAEKKTREAVWAGSWDLLKLLKVGPPFSIEAWIMVEEEYPP